ncbi:MAG: fumarylacetoacetate hydrolase [Pseudonocardia sp. SCN 72-86]|nr:MAG: fumarylacetoacetate hydrolase [Pseudonocardia sp. SCN 72-86]
MRFGNLSGRATLFDEHGAVDVAEASDGLFGPDPQSVLDRWSDFLTWAKKGGQLRTARPFDHADLGAPSPRPPQVFAIGLNYADHVKESRLDLPTDLPAVFTKFRGSISGPISTVKLPSAGHVDWEVELVVVIGALAAGVPARRGWDVVAGVTVGQDISERVTQMAGPAPQFSLGKSFPGFSPMGPWMVTLDELDDPDDLALSCFLDGEKVQDGRTRDLIFSVPQIVEFLSRVTPLYPGDVIFTGTPAGVGMGRNPQRFLRPGEELVSAIAGIGELHQRFV